MNRHLSRDDALYPSCCSLSAASLYHRMADSAKPYSALLSLNIIDPSFRTCEPDLMLGSTSARTEAKVGSTLMKWSWYSSFALRYAALTSPTLMGSPSLAAIAIIVRTVSGLIVGDDLLMPALVRCSRSSLDPSTAARAFSLVGLSVVGFSFRNTISRITRL